MSRSTRGRATDRVLPPSAPKPPMFVEDAVGRRPGVGGGVIGSSGFFGYYEHSSSSFMEIDAATWTAIPNDKAGSGTVEVNLPGDVSTLVDSSNGAVDPSELFIGDSILVRVDYTINQTSDRSLLKFRFSLGTGDDAYTIEAPVTRLDSGASVEYRFSIDTVLINLIDANTRDNDIQPEIYLEGGGTYKSSAISIEVLKHNQGD